VAAILDIPDVRQRLSPLSVEEYHRLGEFNEHGRRSELIRGYVIEKMSKSPLHRTISSLLYKLLAAQLPAGHAVWKEEPLTLADSEPEPDISVTLGTETDFSRVHPTTAELVVEVSVSSPALDRENASLYAEGCVKEYWIVLGLERLIEIYTIPQNGRYQRQRVVGVNETLVSASLEGVSINTGQLFL
jgi:Uma2 family endonuclease